MMWLSRPRCSAYIQNTQRAYRTINQEQGAEVVEIENSSISSPFIACRFVSKKQHTNEPAGTSGMPPGKPASLPPAPSQTTFPEAATAFAVFKLSIARARNLIKIHQTAHGNQSRPESYLADAHRAAVVLAVSALDAYVRTCCLERVRRIVADRTRDLPAALAGDIKKFLKEDGLLEAARKDDLLSRVDKAFRNDFERKSFQGVKNITECLQLVGIEDVFHEIAVRESLNEDNLKQDLDRFTKRRHVIAHHGDHDLSQNPPVENTIRKKDAEDCIKLITKIAQSIHDASKVT